MLGVFLAIAILGEFFRAPGELLWHRMYSKKGELWFYVPQFYVPQVTGTSSLILGTLPKNKFFFPEKELNCPQNLSDTVFL